MSRALALVFPAVNRLNRLGRASPLVPRVLALLSPQSPVANPRTLGTTVALGRIGLGVAAVLRPELPAKPWIGAGPASTPGVQVLARALGGRDVALGLAALAGQFDPRARRLTGGLGALADGVDLAATLLAWKDLPRGGRWMILAITAGATGLGAYSAVR